jgi:hypothetical protein
VVLEPRHLASRPHSFVLVVECIRHGGFEDVEEPVGVGVPLLGEDVATGDDGEVSRFDRSVGVDTAVSESIEDLAWRVLVGDVDALVAGV